MANSPQQPNLPKQPPLKDAMLSRYNRKADRLVVIAATALTLVILGIWGWSMKTQLSLIHWNNSQEKGLVTITEDSWNKAFKNTGNDAATIANLKEQIVESIKTISATITSSTSATTTLQTVTTTPATSTAATTTITN